MKQNHDQLVGLIDKIANKLRGPYKPAQYRRVMLPMTVLRRMDLVLVTLPPTFIQRERDSEFEFCRFGRVGQRGLARSFAGCAASGPVAG